MDWSRSEAEIERHLDYLDRTARREAAARKKPPPVRDLPSQEPMPGAAPKQEIKSMDGPKCKGLWGDVPCDRLAVAQGYCGSHYTRLRRGQDINAPRKYFSTAGVCRIEGCGRPVFRRQLCSSHYYREYNSRKTTASRTKAPAAPKLGSKQEVKAMDKPECQVDPPPAELNGSDRSLGAFEMILDFTGREYLFHALARMARENYRTVELQVLACIDAQARDEAHLVGENAPA